jgi:hypothetical protein
LAPVHTIVATCNVLILAAAIQTQFQDPPKEVQVENSAASPRVPTYVEYLLTRPGLDSLGLESAYLPATSADNATYTIYGTPFDGLTAAQKRHISAVFTWDSDLLYRMNQRVLTTYHLQFDLSAINDLDPTLFSFHVSLFCFSIVCRLPSLTCSTMPHSLDLTLFNPPNTFHSLIGIFIPMRKSLPSPPTTTNPYTSSTNSSSHKFWMVFNARPIFFLSIVALFSSDPSNVSPIASTPVALFVFLPSLSASLLSYNRLLFACLDLRLLLRRPLFKPPCWLMLFLSSVPTLTSLKGLFMLVLRIASARTGIAQTPVLIVVTFALHPAPTFVVIRALMIAVLFVPTIAQLSAKNFEAMPAALPPRISPR